MRLTLGCDAAVNAVYRVPTASCVGLGGWTRSAARGRLTRQDGVAALRRQCWNRSLDQRWQHRQRAQARVNACSAEAAAERKAVQHELPRESAADGQVGGELECPERAFGKADVAADRNATQADAGTRTPDPFITNA